MRPAPRPRPSIPRAAVGRDLFGVRARPRVDAWLIGVDQDAEQVERDAMLAELRQLLKEGRVIYGDRVRAGILDPGVARRRLVALTAIYRAIRRS